MATEKLVESLARRIDRRNFLKKLGTGAIGALLAMMGLSQGASAAHGGCPPGLVDAQCCCLCKQPSQSCNNCVCTWCWSCVLGGTWLCCECHTQNNPCIDDCPDVNCSYMQYLGAKPPR